MWKPEHPPCKFFLMAPANPNRCCNCFHTCAAHEEKPMGDKFKDISDEELEAEAKRRKEKKETPPKPAPLNKVDWTGLYNYVTSQVEQHAKDGFEDDDFKHYVYETVMNAIWPENSYWPWRNRQEW